MAAAPCLVLYQHCRLNAQLGSAPVPPLRIVANFVVRPETDPVRNRSVLPCLLGQDLLRPESLLGRHADDLGKR